MRFSTIWLLLIFFSPFSLNHRLQLKQCKCNEIYEIRYPYTQTHTHHHNRFCCAAYRMNNILLVAFESSNPILISTPTTWSNLAKRYPVYRFNCNASPKHGTRGSANYEQLEKEKGNLLLPFDF